MTELEIKPGQIIEASKDGKPALLRVQVITDDKRVVFTKLGNRMTVSVTRPETIINGGEVDGWKIPGLLRKEEV